MANRETRNSPFGSKNEKKGISNIAVVYSLNDWSQSIYDNFIEESNIQGIRIVKAFPTDPYEDDFRTIITKIKDLDVDAVYVPFAFYPSQGAFSKQAKEMKLSLPTYSSSGTENPVLLESFPEIENTIYPYRSNGPQEEEFNAKYIERFGSFPSPASAYAYDSINLIVLALKEGNESPEEISKYLHSIKNYPGVSNVISFNNEGRVVQKEHIIKTVKDGEFVIVN